MRGAQSTEKRGPCLQPKATAVWSELPGRLLALGGLAQPLAWAGAPCSEQRGFPWSCAGPVAQPVSEVWFPFAESCFPQTAPHPPRPGASEGLSPTLSWQPLGCLCVPPVTPTSGTGIGGSWPWPPPPISARNPKPVGEPELPGRPWGLGPSTGSTSGRVAKPLASCLLLPPPSPRPFLSPLARGSAKHRGGSTPSARPSRLRPRVGVRPGAEVTRGAVGSTSPALACPLLGAGSRSICRLVLGRPWEQGTR